MIVRQLKKRTYRRFFAELTQYAHAEPLGDCYIVTLFLNKREFCLKLQPESGRKIVVLQAFEVEREPWGPSFIDHGSKKMLSTLLDCLLLCGVPRLDIH